MKIEKYISGKYALNIHHPYKADEPTGDWHGFIWDNIKELPNKNVTYAGNGFPINTFHVWNDFGIFDDTEYFKTRNILLKENNVYIADYYRAILDMVYYHLISFNNLLGLNCITYDHLDNDNQVMIVLDNIQLLKKNIDKTKCLILDNWIEKEKNYEHYRKTG